MVERFHMVEQSPVKASALVIRDVDDGIVIKELLFCFKTITQFSHSCSEYFNTPAVFPQLLGVCFSFISQSLVACTQ